MEDPTKIKDEETDIFFVEEKEKIRCPFLLRILDISVNLKYLRIRKFINI